MEFNGLLVLAIVWFLMSLITRAAGKKPKPTSSQRPPQRPPRPLPLPTRPGGTQQEGHRLELVLRQLEKSLGQQIEVEPEEGQSLEVEPEVASLEGEVHRTGRRQVDQDDEAEGIEIGRVKAAALRDTANTRAGPAIFDEKIRQEPADHTAVQPYTAKQLRDAIVWREILGPPVSLRQSEPDSSS